MVISLLSFLIVRFAAYVHLIATNVLSQLIIARLVSPRYISAITSVYPAAVMDFILTNQFCNAFLAFRLVEIVQAYLIVLIVLIIHLSCILGNAYSPVQKDTMIIIKPARHAQTLVLPANKTLQISFV